MAKRPSKSAPRDTEPAPAPPAPLVHPAPVLFAQIVGQDRALGVLTDALRSDRIHHAWIFHGPMGVGKLTAALAFASLLLDPTTAPGLGGEFEADPESPAQRMLRAGAHPDLHVVTKELAKFHSDAAIRDRKQSSIPVDVVREFVLEPGALAPAVRTTSRAGRVFIIDEAELLNAAGQNALLKFLEEPPARVVIILVTSSEERLLPTIRSRAQRVQFAALGQQAMRAWIKAAGVDASAEEAAWLTDLAEGSPGVFSQAKAAGLFEWGQRLAPMLEAADQGRYTIEMGGVMHECADAWAEAWVKARPNASKDAANKAGADWVLRMLSAHGRARLRSSKGRDQTDAALARLDAIRQAEPEIDANVNLQFVFEKLSAELAAAATPAR